MISNFEKNYRRLLAEIFVNGEELKNRTGVNAITLFNQAMNIDVRQGFPIITGKQIFFDKAVAEFEWMYNGRTDTEFLNERNVKWWNKFAVDGDTGKTYGYQIRRFNGYLDQLERVVEEITSNSRRAIITFWNPCDVQILPPCYTTFTFVRVGSFLNMQMNIRSSDVFLGLPYDICIGALFLYKIAGECGLIARELGLSLANAHIYVNHLAGVRQYMNQKTYTLPYLVGYDSLMGYRSSAFIPATLN